MLDKPYLTNASFFQLTNGDVQKSKIYINFKFKLKHYQKKQQKQQYIIIEHN